MRPIKCMSMYDDDDDDEYDHDDDNDDDDEYDKEWVWWATSLLQRYMRISQKGKRKSLKTR